ncbi:HAMP domain-containing histidine kinase [Hyphomonadaceae bacterium ML37]|nr:HAMP domain-containing histidine kinase [Hyphomonadaceae bacterium ML37]
MTSVESLPPEAAGRKPFRFAMLRSTFARLAALIAVLVSLASTVVFVIAYVAFAYVSDQTLRQLVDTDAAGLVDIYTLEGEPGLRRSIQDRLALRPLEGEGPVYLLTDPDGEPLAGNLTRWPEAFALDASWVRGDFTVDDEPLPVLGRAFLMPQDYRLFVGRSTTSQAQAQARLRTIFIAGFFITLTLGIAAGLVAAGWIMTRVERLNRTCQAVRDGAIDQRAPGADGVDEFGLLSRNVNAMLDRIERLISAQRDVSDLTAHELRTPLIRIDRTLADALDDPARVEDAREQLAELGELINSLMDISAISAEIGDTRGLEILDLAALARSVTPLYDDVAAEKGARVKLDAPRPVMMRGSPAQLGRLIANLLDNAVKFLPDGGEVTVIVRDGPVLIVEDNGPGVPADWRERVFMRFARISHGGPRGHGLGLSFVHAVARRHALAIEVEDARPGAARPGARFIVRPAGGA